MNRRCDLEAREKDKFRGRHSRTTKSGEFNKLAGGWKEGEREKERAFTRRMQPPVATSDRRAMLRVMHRRRHPSAASLARCSLHRDSTDYTLVFGTSGRCYRELTRTSH